jgi:hypothetical protein
MVTHSKFFRLIIVWPHGVLLLVISLIHPFMISDVTSDSDRWLGWSTTRGPTIHDEVS